MRHSKRAGRTLRSALAGLLLLALSIAGSPAFAAAVLKQIPKS
jgi:hypothetical protein